MKKILIAGSLILLFSVLFAGEEKDDTAWFDASRSCFQFSIQPYRPYLRMFPSDIPVNGVNFSYYSAQKKLHGFSMAVLDRSTETEGFAMELFNCADLMRGFSLSLISWHNVLDGVAVALVNVAEKRGSTLQFGLYNHARAGWQIGLLNYNRNGRYRLMPFLNFSPEEN